MNANIIKTQFTYKMKYDLRGHIIILKLKNHLFFEYIKYFEHPSYKIFSRMSTL